jgi:SAM-dependent methyltransferase
VADGGTLYDALPYPARAFDVTHPSRLAANARLFGVEAPPVATARVLELGCADGGNLLAMTASLPAAELIGVDLSEREVESGRGRLRALGATNLALEVRDVCAVGGELGAFDYAIVHGLFSWVPEPVQEAVLALLARSLTPNGVAYVSYNLLPGWHLRAPIRDLLRRADRPELAAAERVARARALLSRLEKAELHPHLAAEVARMQERDDPALFHDEMNAENAPLSFEAFLARAAAHGLDFVSEGHLGDLGLFDPLAVELAGEGEDAASEREREALSDLLRLRPFRATLLCRRGARRRGVPGAAELAPLYLLARFGRARGAVGPSARYVGERGATIETADPLAIATLDALAGAFPRPLAGAELVAQVRGALAAPPAADELEARVAAVVLRCAVARLVELHAHVPPVAFEPGERPRASAWAREQIRAGGVVTNLWHRSVSIDSAHGRALLPLLDGTRGRDALAHALGISEETVEAELALCAFSGVLLRD